MFRIRLPRRAGSSASALFSRIRRAASGGTPRNGPAGCRSRAGGHGRGDGRVRFRAQQICGDFRAVDGFGQRFSQRVQPHDCGHGISAGGNDGFVSGVSLERTPGRAVSLREKKGRRRGVWRKGSLQQGFQAADISGRQTAQFAARGALLDVFAQRGAYGGAVTARIAQQGKQLFGQSVWGTAVPQQERITGPGAVFVFLRARSRSAIPQRGHKDAGGGSNDAGSPGSGENIRQIGNEAGLAARAGDGKAADAGMRVQEGKKRGKRLRHDMSPEPSITFSAGQGKAAGTDHGVRTPEGKAKPLYPRRTAG